MQAHWTPLASGLLIICVGVHTKTINELMGMDKTYEGKFQIGSTTPSFDLETEVDHTFPIPELDVNGFNLRAQEFIGNIEQFPPIFSAKKIDGKKAYELARKGKEVTMKPSQITISGLNLSYDSYPEISFELQCSKGTYVRSLAHDFGKAIGSGAHLIELRRTKIGRFSIDSAFTIEGAMKHIEDEYIKYLKTASI